METDEIADIQALINIFFPFAEELLLKFGEFSPYAGATTINNDFVAVGSREKTMDKNSELVIKDLKKELKTASEAYKVAAVFYDVRVKDENSGISRDAICVFVEHKNSTTAYEFYYPYQLENKEALVTDDNYGNAVSKEIFNP